jgi:hypothetical protein
MLDLLYTLLGFDVPAGTSLRALEFQFRGELAWWIVLPLALFLVALVLLLYVTERGKVHILLRLPMAAFRWAALIFLLLLICKPVLQGEFEGKRPREIVVLIDNTQSMKQQDRRLNLPDKLRVAIAADKLAPNTPVTGDSAPKETPTDTPTDPSREHVLRDAFANPRINLLANLQKRGPVVPQLFGYDTRNALSDFTLVQKRTVTAKEALAQFRADQTQTALADSINNLLQRRDADLPAAIVVISDGRDNASKYSLDEVAQECARLKVPLHIYGIGSAQGGRIKVRDLFVASTLFAEDTVTIPVRWRADGMEKGNAAVTVAVAGMTKTEIIPITPGQDQVTEFKFALPKLKDRVENSEVTARVELQGDPTFKDDTKQPVRIIDGKVKVLYIEYAPRKEYHFLQTAMLRDRRIDPRFWLITADPKASEGGPFEKEFPTKKEILNQYDLVILGDVPADKLKSPQRKMLAEFVSKNRGGLVVIAGRQHMPAEFASDTELAPLLPVEFNQVRFPADGPGSPQSYHPVKTAAGQRADWLMLADNLEENEKTWQDLPGFFWYYPVTKLRPGATPLLAHPTAKMGEQPMPLLAYQAYGKGQVLFFGFEETWRWRLNTQDKIFGRFWGQVLLYMALPHKLAASATRVELSVDRSALELGKPGMLYARLFDHNFEPLQKDAVQGVLEYLDAQPGQEHTFPLVLEPVAGRKGEGEYQAVLPNQWPGRWQVRLTDPEGATLQFTVKVPVKHELEEAPMAEDLLQAAASVSGGRFYREENLHELPSQIEGRESSYILRQELNLWGPLAFLIFAGLVTCEWLGRKFANLS